MMFSRANHTQTGFSYQSGAASAFTGSGALRPPISTTEPAVARQARWPVSPVLQENNDWTTADNRRQPVAPPFPARLPV